MTRQYPDTPPIINDLCTCCASASVQGGVTVQYLLLLPLKKKKGTTKNCKGGPLSPYLFSSAAMELYSAWITSRTQLPHWSASRPLQNGSQRSSYPKTPASGWLYRVAGTSRSQSPARLWHAQPPRSGWVCETRCHLPCCTSRMVHRGYTRSMIHDRSGSSTSWNSCAPLTAE